MKNKRDRLFFTQLFVPQASQSSQDRRAELEVLLAVPSAQSVCGMEDKMPIFQTVAAACRAAGEKMRSWKQKKRTDRLWKVVLWGILWAMLCPTLGACGAQREELFLSEKESIAYGAVSYTHLDVYKRQAQGDTGRDRRNGKHADMVQRGTGRVCRIRDLSLIHI